MLNLLCFRWQNLESRGAQKKETLQVFSQLLPLRVCRISSKSNKLQGKTASEEKSGQTKKINFYEMLDLLCFQWKNLDSNGAYEVETLHVANQLPPLCVCQISFKSNNFQVKRASEEKMVKQKRTIFTRCPRFFASNDKILSQGERRKLRLYM